MVRRHRLGARRWILVWILIAAGVVTAEGSRFAIRPRHAPAILRLGFENERAKRLKNV